MNSIFLRILFLFFCYTGYASLQGYGQNFMVRKSKDGIQILEKGKKVLFYQAQPKSVDGKYERAGYIHPLYSLKENELTEESQEPYHLYHRGVFWGWLQIMLHDKKIADGWTSQNISFGPAMVKLRHTNKSITLQAEMLWTYLPEKEAPLAIIRENTNITVHSSTIHYRAIDFDIHLYALVDSLKIGGTDDMKGLGGFSMRLKLPADISFISKNGKVVPEETSVDAGSWVDFTGSFDGSDSVKSGVAAFAHPNWPAGRQKWILRKKGSMQNIVYPGRIPVAVSKNGLRLTYRLIIHDNTLNNADLEKLYQQYIRRG